jgi:release factor glutamine methyltransferase
LGLLLGRQRFLGLEFVTREAVIAPREEGELIGREALAITRTLVSGSPEREVWIADVGCGSGNMACALAFHQPRARVWASDLAAASVALAQENVARHGLEARVRVEQGDLLGPLRDLGLEGAMDLVMMNPPYIPSASLERSHAPLLLFEPREAFDGGPYGLTILCRMLREAPSFLKPGGHLLLEFGLGQDRLVQTFAVRNNSYVDFRLVANAEGDARVAILRV